jgi:hypothetical protein
MCLKVDGSRHSSRISRSRLSKISWCRESIADRLFLDRRRVKSKKTAPKAMPDNATVF